MGAADTRTLRDSEYAKALSAIEAAQRTVLLWADSVSADVERRLGVTSSDPRRHNEPEYAAALDVVGLVVDAVQKMRSAS
jgi:hypothetical protein